MVVLFHANLIAYLGGVDDASLTTLGAAGVDIFFVISGAVMWLSTTGRDQTPGQFWRNRAVRIVPLYYVLTLVFVGVVAVSGRFVSTGDALTSLLFIPAENSLTGEPMPILGVGWTLNFEMMFYALFGLTLLLPERRRIPAMAAAFMCLIALRFVTPSDSAFMVRISSPLWLEFLAGMVIGLIVQRGWLRSQALGWALLVGGVAALVTIQLVMPGLPRTIVWGGPAAMIVLGCVLLEPLFRARLAAPLKALGDSSYSLYLVHAVWIEVLAFVAMPPAVRFVAIIAGSVALGFLSLRTIERPLMRAASRKPTAPHTQTDTSPHCPHNSLVVLNTNSLI